MPTSSHEGLRTNLGVGRLMPEIRSWARQVWVDETVAVGEPAGLDGACHPLCARACAFILPLSPFFLLPLVQAKAGAKSPHSAQLEAWRWEARLCVSVGGALA